MMRRSTQWHASAAMVVAALIGGPTLPTISSSINIVTGDAFTFSASPESLKVLSGVVVGSYIGDGADSSFKDSSVDNFGLLYSDALNGISFFSDNGTITNERNGQIQGAVAGVDIDRGNTEVINNSGFIFAYDTAVLFNVNSNFSSKLINGPSGIIQGYQTGVECLSKNAGATIDNFNVITGADVGIVIDTTDSASTVITNESKGQINGGIETIAGAMSLTNNGTISGDVVCSSPDGAVIVNQGKMIGNVVLAMGNDVFDGRHGTSGTIYAGSGNDRIIGGIGPAYNPIFLGTGNDTITGCRNDFDRFFFNGELHGQVDKITNFVPHYDGIVLSKSDFPGIGPAGHVLAAADFLIGQHATTHAQHILYDPANGFLFYDPDGKGPHPHVHFATLSHHLALTHGNFLVTA
jgi:hypothetical protein